MATNGKVSVKVRNNNVDGAIKLFKKRVMDTGILQEYKKRQEFEKPSVTKRRKKKESIWKQKLEDKNRTTFNI